MLKKYKININGQVQGVGFRPFVYKLAHKFDLRGYVSNDASGVVIEVQGEEKLVNDFYDEIITNPPSVSRI